MAASVFAVAIFVLCHPYLGLRGDATIYMLRALADLDPGGLGRDLAVAEDGQMRFSLFPLLLRPLCAMFGASHAALLVAALGNAAWLAALSALAWRLAPGRIAIAMVAMVSVLPLGYGAHDVITFAETAATPRPLAEAAVMAGLAAMLAGRYGLAAIALIFGAVIHPIMAACGLGVAALSILGRLSWPWRIALAGAGLIAVGAAARLAMHPDGAWLTLLRLRNAHLFPTLWISDSFPPLIAQVATILVAAHRAAPPQRRLLLAVVIVCGVALAAEIVLGDTLGHLFFIQTQAWRATWLVGVIGGCALAFCAAVLWPNGPAGRITLSLLALAWFFQPTPWVTLAIAGLALSLEFGSSGHRLRDGHAIIVGLVSLTLCLVWASGWYLGYLAYLRAMPEGHMPSLVDMLRGNALSLPLCAAIAVWLNTPAVFREPRVTLAVTLGSLCLLAAGILQWDRRSAAQTFLESPHPPAALATLAADRKPEVLWLDNLADAWFALSRPQYFSPQQGVGIVFSWPLARELTRRADVLMHLKLVAKNVDSPWKPAADDDREQITQANIDAFCARPDAPGLVIFPRDAGQPTLRDMIDWPLPAPIPRLKRYVSGDEWHRTDSFGIVPCAPRAYASPR